MGAGASHEYLKSDPYTVSSFGFCLELKTLTVLPKPTTCTSGGSEPASVPMLGIQGISNGSPSSSPAPVLRFEAETTGQSAARRRSRVSARALDNMGGQHQSCQAQTNSVLDKVLKQI